MQEYLLLLHVICVKYCYHCLAPTYTHALGYDQRNIDVPPHCDNPVTSKDKQNYRQRANQFFQENRIKPQYEFTSDRTTIQPRYRCVVRYTISGESRKIDSRHFYSSKSDAKEQVAKLVLLKEVTQVTSKGTSSPPSKVWKSKLKEYCDKNKAVVELMPSYSTVSSGSGFISTVTFLKSEYQGEECKSKQDTEQSAAYHAFSSVQ